MADSAITASSELEIIWSPGLIVTSFLVSVAGAWVALELVRLRTSNRGWMNWMLLIMASLVTGILAIFVMHFVGMAAFQLKGELQLPMYFQTGLTVGSLIEPIFCVCAGVYVTGAQEDPTFLQFFSGGALAALGITVMHFTAMKAMRVALDWIPALVALSCAIAWLATTTTFVLFFRLRAMWQASVIKQCGCAVLLAGAICAMHYTGMVAAHYSIDPRYPPTGPALSDGTLSVDDVLKIGLGLTAVCGVVLLGLVILRWRNHSHDSHHSKGQLVLASILVDPRGHVMVDSLGHLPSRAVIGSFDFENVSSPMAHPALLWLLKASCNWDKVSHLGVALRKNGPRANHLLEELLGPVPSPFDDSASLEMSRLPFYRASLIQAANSLTAYMGIPMKRLGVLHDTVLKAKEGWVALIVDRLDNRRAEHFKAKGFRWTDPKHVVNHLAKHLQVEAVAIRAVISDTPDFVRTRKRPIRKGLHVGVLCVYPRIGHFEVMVPSRERSNIPSIELSPIAFAALREHSCHLRDYLAPIMSSSASSTMVVADYVAASELLSALTRLGISLDNSGPMPLESLNPPEDVLVLHRKVKHGMDEPSDTSVHLDRENLPWVSRVKSCEWTASPNSPDADIQLFMQIHSFTTSKFSPPPGFQFIDLAIFEAMHYPRCFPGIRSDRVIGLELNAEWNQSIVPTLTPEELQMLESKTRLHETIQCDPPVHPAAVTDTANGPAAMQSDQHSIVYVDQFLREGPPEPPTPIDVPLSIEWSLHSRSPDHRLTERLRGAALMQILIDYRSELAPEKGLSRRGQVSPTPAVQSLSHRIDLDESPMSPYDIFTETESDDDTYDDLMPVGAGADANPATAAWQAMRWVKLYVNSALQSGTMGSYKKHGKSFAFGPEDVPLAETHRKSPVPQLQHQPHSFSSQRSGNSSIGRSARLANKPGGNGKSSSGPSSLAGGHQSVCTTGS
ncbi:hypothetical protein HKX48_006978 [Thoreauomyces humboldtii]|nr:hypothetical protein HKX48_006978 [Thoreauomyces humboldtii]